MMDHLPEMLERLRAYGDTQDDGSVQMDLKKLSVDLIALLKSMGRDKQTFLMMMDSLWDDVDVEVTNVNKDN